MPLTTMVILMLFVLLLTGVLDGTVREIGLSRPCIYYFLTCAIVLYGFNALIIPEVEINPASLLVLTMTAILAARRNEDHQLSVIPAALLLALPTVILGKYLPSSELLLCGISALPALCILTKRELSFSLAAAAAAPIAAGLLQFVLDMNLTGYGCVVFDAATVDMQFIGLFAVCAAHEAKVYFQKLHPVRSRKSIQPK